jgi:hypothetical protein
LTDVDQRFTLKEPCRFAPQLIDDQIGISDRFNWNAQGGVTYYEKSSCFLRFRRGAAQFARVHSPWGAGDRDTVGFTIGDRSERD